MNNESNPSEDPSCRGDPPVAIDIILNLDMFGVILYSLLTFMSAVSMLIYLEECFYIYRKITSNKKSAIIWVNGAAPVIGSMSCLGMWIPRATMITDMASACYFAIVVFKFLILMLEEVGGDELFLKRAGKHKLKISTGPCCCCCLCLPHVAITRLNALLSFNSAVSWTASVLYSQPSCLFPHRVSQLTDPSDTKEQTRSLFLLKLGSFQFAILKIALTVLSIVLWTDGNFDLADTTMSGSVIWINSLVGILTIIALWPVSIMFLHLKAALQTHKIVPKYAMYQMVLILSQLQTAIINILALCGTIACAPPFSAAARGHMISQQLLILEMFIITLVTRMLYRRQYDPLPAEEEYSNAMM